MMRLLGSLGLREIAEKILILILIFFVNFFYVKRKMKKNEKMEKN